MNHYERLKVSPGAPIEVIRAAYRALAAKHHPDRHTQSESAHGDMVALNAAYEILANPDTRAAYDAELAEAGADADDPSAGPDTDSGASRLQNLWRTTMGFGARDTEPPSQPAQDEPAQSRVDVLWQPPLPAGVVNPWLSRQRLKYVIGGVGAVALVMGALWTRATLRQIEAEQTLSQHYGDTLEAGARGAPTAHRPAVAMTDAELLAEPPPLPGQASSAARAPHVLDGAPLGLRQDTHLLDPLAPPPAHP